MMMRCLAFVLVLVAVARGMPAEAPKEEEGVVASAMKFIKECGDGELSLCIKERALRYVDGLSGDLEVSEGVSLVKSSESSRQQGARSLKDEPLSAEPEVREGQVESLLVERVARFLEGHTLQFKVPKDSIDEMQRSLEEGRKKKGAKKLLPLLLLLKLKAAALIPLLLGFLAIVAFKALIIAKLALVISGVIALKKLLGGKGGHGGGSSYEVVPSHHHEEHHGWGRKAQDLAYNAYKPE